MRQHLLVLSALLAIVFITCVAGKGTMYDVTVEFAVTSRSPAVTTPGPTRATCSALAKHMNSRGKLSTIFRCANVTENAVTVKARGGRLATGAACQALGTGLGNIALIFGIGYGNYTCNMATHVKTGAQCEHFWESPICDSPSPPPSLPLSPSPSVPPSLTPPGSTVTATFAVVPIGMSFGTPPPSASTCEALALYMGSLSASLSFSCTGATGSSVEVQATGPADAVDGICSSFNNDFEFIKLLLGINYGNYLCQMVVNVQTSNGCNHMFRSPICDPQSPSPPPPQETRR